MSRLDALLDDFINDAHTGPNDYPAVREIDLGNNNKLYVRKTDPYGFFKFSLEHGQLPNWIKGDYTSISETEKAIAKYIRERELSPPKDLGSIIPKEQKRQK